MDARPFKFRHINRIVGAFLFATAGIFVILIVLAAKSQSWFEPTTIYRVEMPGGIGEEDGSGGTMGIRPGSDVRVIGSQVGHVRSIILSTGDELKPIEAFEEVDPNDIRIVAVLGVKGDFAKFIGPDSKAVLKFDLGGLGSAYFDISRGTKRFGNLGDGAPRILQFEKQADAKEEVFEIVKRIETEIVPAIQSYKKTADSATNFIEKLSDEEEVFLRSMLSLEEGIADLNKVIARAESGDGALGDMISSDSQMRKEFNEFAVTLNRTSQNLEGAIDNLNEGITNLREGGVQPFNRAAQNFPTTVSKTNNTIDDIDKAAHQLNETLREIEVLTEGLQKHWLVRKYVEDPLEDDKPAAHASEKRTSRKAPSTEKEEKGLFKGLFQKKDKNSE